MCNFICSYFIFLRGYPDLFNIHILAPIFFYSHLSTKENRYLGNGTCCGGHRLLDGLQGYGHG